MKSWWNLAHAKLAFGLCIDILVPIQKFRVLFYMLKVYQQDARMLYLASKYSIKLFTVIIRNITHNITNPAGEYYDKFGLGKAQLT